jgi:hypothetical protein
MHLCVSAQTMVWKKVIQCHFWNGPVITRWNFARCCAVTSPHSTRACALLWLPCTRLGRQQAHARHRACYPQTPRALWICSTRQLTPTFMPSLLMLVLIRGRIPLTRLRRGICPLFWGHVLERRRACGLLQVRTRRVMRHRSVLSVDGYWLVADS